MSKTRNASILNDSASACDIAWDALSLNIPISFQEAAKVYEMAKKHPAATISQRAFIFSEGLTIPTTTESETAAIKDIVIQTIFANIYLLNFNTLKIKGRLTSCLIKIAVRHLIHKEVGIRIIYGAH